MTYVWGPRTTVKLQNKNMENLVWGFIQQTFAGQNERGRFDVVELFGLTNQRVVIYEII